MVTLPSYNEFGIPDSVSLSTDEAIPNVSENNANIRAEKASFGLDDQPGDNKEIIKGKIQTGQEEPFRNQVAAEVDEDNWQKRQASMVAAAQTGAMYDPETLAKITSTIEPQDPHSVIEDTFARKFVDWRKILDNPWTNSTFLAEAEANNPAQADYWIKNSEAIVRKSEFAKTRAQEIDDHMPSWYDFSPWTHIKRTFDLYQEANLRGLDGNMYLTSMLGTALDQTRQELWKLPYPQYKARLDVLQKQLWDKDPWLASVFMHAMAGQSDEQIGRQDVEAAVGLAMDASIIGSPTYKGIKGFINGVRNLSLARTMVEATRAVDAGIPADVVQATAVGDMESAAVKAEARKDDALVNSADKNVQPPQLPDNAVPTIIKLGPEPRAPFLPGNLGGEIAARIRAAKQTFDWYNVIKTIRRVDEAPVLRASEIMNQMARDEIKYKYTGPNSHVLEVGDLVHVDDIPDGEIPDEYRGTNVRFAPVRAGTENATYWVSEIDAMNWAERQGVQLQEKATSLRSKAIDKVMRVRSEIESLEKEIEIPGRDAGVEDLNRYHDQTEKLKELQQNLKLAMQARAQTYWHPNEAISAKPGWMLKQGGMGWYLEKWVPVDYYGSIFENLVALNPEARTPMGRTPFTKTTKFVDNYVGDNKEVPGLWQKILAWKDSPTTMIKGLTNPAATMSKTEQSQRMFAVHNPNKMIKVFEKNAKTISRVPRSERNTFARILQDDQTRVDAFGRQGAFYDNVPDFENKWFSMTNGNLPSDRSIQAYFAHKNNIEMDRGLRTIMAGHIKMVHGVQDHMVWSVDATGKRSDSPRFEGITTREFPSSWDAGIAVVREGQTSVFPADETRFGGAIKDPKIRKAIVEELKNGTMTGVRIWNPELKELNDWLGAGPNAHIQYVFTKNLDSQLLDMSKQVPQRGGGHWIYKDPLWVAQANVKQDSITGAMRYMGDNPIVGARSEAEAQAIANHFTKLSKYFVTYENDVLADMRIEAGKLFHESSQHSDLPWEQVKNLWDPMRKDANGNVVGSYFNTTEPFGVKKAGKLLIDTDDSIPRRYGDKFIDGTKSGNPARMAMVKYTQERDSYGLLSAKDVGTLNNPVFKYTSAPLLDPISSMDRGVTEIVNSVFMDEMKNMHINHWLQTAKPFLKQDESEVAYAPYRTFLDPKWRIDADDNVKRILEGNRMKIRQLIGLPNDVRWSMHSWSQSMANSFYGVAGGKNLQRARALFDTDKRMLIPSRSEEAGSRIPRILPIWMINAASEPTAALRGIVFGAKEGFFSIPALWKQAATYVNVVAQAPTVARQATFGALAHEWMKIAPDSALPILGKWSEKMGYLPGEWEEAYNLAKNRFNFTEVAREHAYLDTQARLKTPWSPGSSIPFVGNAARTLRDWHTVFFSEGASMVRAASVYAAHKEWRLANPTGKLGMDAEDWIARRAAKLDHWMSRAWNSTINTGVMSIPGQFYTYARNVAGIVYDKETTAAQRAGMLLSNAVMWGVPAGAVGLYGIPHIPGLTTFASAEGLRQWAQSKGYYIPGSEAISTAVMEGIPSLIAQVISGGGNFQKGTSYSFRGFGSEGLQTIVNFFSPDHGLAQAFGASYNFTKNMMASAQPLLWWAQAHLHGDEFYMRPEYMSGLLKEIASYSRTTRDIYALKSGEWLSKNNALIANNVGWGPALMENLFGVPTNEVADIHIKSNIGKEREEHFEDVRRLYSGQILQGLTALRNDDHDGFTQFSANAQWLLRNSDLNHEDQMKVQEYAFGLHKSLVDSIDESMWRKHVPASVGDSMLRAYQRVQEMQATRGRGPNG